MAGTYVKDDNDESRVPGTVLGATFIPASQRPDGSWRKARRVRDGYVPQEEVPLYESKGKQWAKGKPDLPPGLSKIDIELVQTRQNAGNEPNKAGNKKKKKAETVENNRYDDVLKKLNATKLSDGSKDSKKGIQPTAADPSKKLKNLKKKLREIDALREKIESGSLTDPDKDQLEKVSRRDQVAQEIEDLELSMDE